MKSGRRKAELDNPGAVSEEPEAGGVVGPKKRPNLRTAFRQSGAGVLNLEEFDYEQRH